MCGELHAKPYHGLDSHTPGRLDAAYSVERRVRVIEPQGLVPDHPQKRIHELLPQYYRQAESSVL